MATSAGRNPPYEPVTATAPRNSSGGTLLEAVATGSEMIEGHLEQLVDRTPVATRHGGAGVEPREVEQLVHEVGQTGRLGGHGPGELGSLIFAVWAISDRIVTLIVVMLLFAISASAQYTKTNLTGDFQGEGNFTDPHLKNGWGLAATRSSIAGTFWVADESPPHGTFSPESLGGATVRMLLVVDDLDQDRKIG